MKKIRFLVLLTSILLLTGCSNNKYLQEISFKEYKNLIEEKETFILEVSSSKCSACDMLKPRLKEITNEYKIEVKYIDVVELSDDEYKEFEKLANHDGSTPIIIFYTKGIEETVATRIEGAVPKTKLIDKFTAMEYIKD